MRKVFLFVTVIISFMQPVKEEPLPIEIIVEAAMEEDLQLTSWQIVKDDKMTKAQFDEIMNKLKNDYNVTTYEDDNAVKYIMETESNKHGISHSFHAIIPVNNPDDITLQLVITGTKWNEEIANYYNVLTDGLQVDYSTHFSRTFTCLNLIDSVIINDGSYYKKMLNKLNVENVQKQYDNVQSSTYIAEFYGYTTLWNEKIVVNDDKINFQMMIKENADKHTEIIIGTPIVLNEY